MPDPGWTARVAVISFFCILAAAAPAPAGPPYATDDPVPTDYRNWEIYAGVQYENIGNGALSAGLPFAEFNYGAMPNVQVSILMQNDDDGTTQRPAVTEFGVKTRFLGETKTRPQVAFYPSVQLPISAGAHAIPFLPLWLQKSWGRWTAFGGGGVYLNSGPGQRDYTFTGAALTREISPATAIGAELYHQGASSTASAGVTAANVGVTSQVGSLHAIVFSIGRSFHGPNTFSTYASYEFELGPR